MNAPAARRTRAATRRAMRPAVTAARPSEAADGAAAGHQSTQL